MQLCYRKKVKKFTKRVRYVLEYEHKYWALFFERRDYMGEKQRDKKNRILHDGEYQRSGKRFS